MTTYLITKTIDKRFVYYLGKRGIWQGLKDNAMVFSLYNAEVNLNSLILLNPQEKKFKILKKM